MKNFGKVIDIAELIRKFMFINGILQLNFLFTS